MVCDKILECCNDMQLYCSHKLECKQLTGKKQEFVCKDKGSKREYRLINDKGFNITKYHVDGGIYYEEDNIEKCDFLLVVGSKNLKFLFIELKGKDIKHGLDQLSETITRLKPQLINDDIYARLVYNGGSSVRAVENTPSIISAKKRLRQVLGIKKDNDRRLQSKTLVMKETVSALV